MKKVSLTDIAIKKAKPKEKIYFLSDGRGLMLEVRPSGGKSWVINGKPVLFTGLENYQRGWRSGRA